MRKLLAPFLVLFLLGGCKRSAAPSADLLPKDSLEFQIQRMPDKFQLNPEATALAEDWKEFMDLGSSMDVLYKATNNEDLALAVDDLIEKEKLLEQGQYPEPFDDFRIKSRQLVVRTYLYKLKASILERQPTTAPAVEMLEAYNALRNQMNLIVKTELDKKIILESI